jgi:hypothetical protein
MRRPYEVGNPVRFFYQKFLAIIVGRNETALQALPMFTLRGLTPTFTSLAEW